MNISSIYRLLSPLLLLLTFWTIPANAQRCDVGIDALELDDCCFDLFITNDEIGLTIGGIQVNVLSPVDTIVSSVQPTTWSVTRTPRSLTWTITGGLGSGDFDFAGLCMGAADGTSRVEFVFRNQAGGIACRDTIDLDCVPVITGCVDFGIESVECVTLPTGGKGQELTFSIANLDSCVRTSLSFAVVSPAGVTVTPSILPLSPPLAIFDSATGLKITFSGAGLQGATSLSLVVTAQGTGCSCLDTITIFLANCTDRCFDLTTTSLVCRRGATGEPGYDWVVTLTNQLSCPVATLATRVTNPSAGVTITPSDTTLTPSLAKGDSITLVYRIEGGTPGSSLSILFSPAGATCACDSTLLIRLPDCPPVIDTGCVRIVSNEVLCDPQGDAGDYLYAFGLINNSNQTIDSIRFSTTTPNVIFDPTPFPLPTPLVPAGVLTGMTVRILQGATGTMQVIVEAYGGGGIVCGDSVSIFLPECVTDVPGDRDAGMIMAVHPNPARDRAEIAMHGERPIREGVCEVVDARGVTVIRLPLHNGLEAEDHRFSIDVSGLPAGSYLVRVLGDDRALHRLLRITR